MRITAEQAAQALNISLSTITNYVKILKIKKETINGRVSIALAPDDFLSIAKRIDSIHRTTEKQELVKKYLSGKKKRKNKSFTYATRASADKRAKDVHNRVVSANRQL